MFCAKLLGYLSLDVTNICQLKCGHAYVSYKHIVIQYKHWLNDQGERDNIVSIMQTNISYQLLTTLLAPCFVPTLCLYEALDSLNGLLLSVQ